MLALRLAGSRLDHRAAGVGRRHPDGHSALPTFFLSLAGGLGALGGLALARPLPGASAVSYSLLAALAHMGAQFTAAWWLFIPHPGLWLLFPPFMTAAIVFGLVNGIMACAMIRELDHPPRRDGHEAT